MSIPGIYAPGPHKPPTNSLSFKATPDLALTGNAQRQSADSNKGRIQEPPSSTPHIAPVQTSSTDRYGGRVKKLQGKQLDWRESIKEMRMETEINKLKVEIDDLEGEIDDITMEHEPAVPRPTSPVARMQDGPNCWMFAAASLLRTNQRVPTPHEILVDQMKQIKEELSGFMKDFKDLYARDKARGMNYFIESTWWKLTQSSNMKRLRYFEWNWTESILEGSFFDQGESVILMLQYFWNSHGFSYYDRINWKEDQASSKIKNMPQNERALISMSRGSFETAMRELPDLLPSGKHEPWHAMILDRFDWKTGEYILKNSHGPKGGSEVSDDDDGIIRIRERVFDKLQWNVFFIKKVTSLSKDGWQWAIATVLQKELSRQKQFFLLSNLMTKLKRNWNGSSKRSEMMIEFKFIQM